MSLVMLQFGSELRFEPELNWTELKVRFKVQSFVWTEPKVQFKVQLAAGRFEPEPNLGLKLVNNCEFSWILLEFSAQK